MGGTEPKRRSDFFCALTVGAGAIAVLRLIPYQNWTLTEVVLFSGGAFVGAWAKSSLWTLWLACAVVPWASTTVIDLFNPASHAFANVGLLPVAIIFVAFTWAVTTLFFVAGFVAGRSAGQGTFSARAVLSQVGLPCVAGVAVPLCILALAKATGGQRLNDGPWPLLIVIASCFVLGTFARLMGHRASSLARVVGVAVGVNIGLAVWMSAPELSNLGPLLLAVLAIASGASIWAGARFASVGP
ncbi:MAG TPA: hypothetical protein VK540_34605 [Polyangiaceae bacterium]|nr:hypothetical protein [Polyangiaceae bacterium]